MTDLPPPGATPDLLRAEAVRKTFGALAAVDRVDLTLQDGVLAAIIGPNGAGKTTLINLLSGALAPDGGRVFFQGQEITHLPVHARVRLGLTRSFQVMNVFPRLTVRENVLLPVLARRRPALSPLGRLDADRDALDEAEALLQEVGLLSEAHREAATLAHGDQRRLELAIAVAPRPVLCFLDEPSSGMTPPERAMVLDLVRRLARERRTTFVVVEHDMDVVFALAARIIVMNRGRVLADGPPEAIRANPQVREVYLGEEAP
ncbi:MAG: ABC transporter ATP-binding protein [Armatimonadota bacterium]|nr:ABC transporter ATP-binding protein [Armatimonadota bacterium]MDR7485755.1 ABC transporter ATP-binding protein [Armatimonadota bacterium]MDR7534097.1 ABC transporter ATP-binding protein [Armatimonadota bacterium]MDR7537566.1 ABC transporter ATP-binding protein [Armatimonadota bacterium]